MSNLDKCLKETTEYTAEDAKFMEMAINLSVDNIDSGGWLPFPFPMHESEK